jgi:GT2 family glycosyltransferase
LLSASSCDATLVIPQFRRSELTERCVQTFRAHHGPDPSILIVDDGSPPEEVERLRSALGGAATILDQPRCGVTAAWNAGLHASRSAHLVFLNNDTVTYGAWLDRLLVPLRANAARMIGVAWRQERQLPAVLARQRRFCRLLTGWCFAIARADLVALGGFDASLRRYFSDTDLQLRLLTGDAEDPLLAVEGLPLVHLGHATAHRLADRATQWERDRRLFQAKWHRWERACLERRLPAGEEDRLLRSASHETT